MVEPGTAEWDFLGRVVAGPNCCWIWVSHYRPGNGGLYGIFRGPRGRGTVGAHRWSYEHFIGPIPEGLQIDHLCRESRCVNPAHMEPVTARENIRRGTSPMAAHARKTHCPAGHPYDKANTRVYRGGRYCRTCNNLPLLNDVEPGDLL